MQLFVKHSKFHVEATRFFRSYIGGVVYFWSGYAVFAILYSGLGWDWLYAKIVCDIIGVSLNYIVQRYWAFKDLAHGQAKHKTAGKFTLVSVVGILVDYLIIAGLKQLGVSPYLGFFISAGCMTVWNFGWYRFWVFIHKKKG